LSVVCASLGYTESAYRISGGGRYAIIFATIL
jgi:hypothetical protein